MTEVLILFAFAAGLLTCVCLNISVLYALILGYGVFFGYGVWKRCNLGQLFTASVKAAGKVRNIIIVFLMIGAMTALWRICGTVPALIFWSAGLLHPSVLLLLCFLLNSLMSLLTGTSFGTVATMGVTCMSIANTAGLDPRLTGGAILAGVFLGDRCSPVSSGALLVAEVTGTNTYDNIRGMFRTSWLPFVISCALYLILGLTTKTANCGTDIQKLFTSAFRLPLVVLIPAVVILAFSAFRIPAKKTMLVSILCAGAISMLVQKTPFALLVRTILLGYHAPSGKLAALLDGGGVISMVRVSLIVGLSSSYAGLFEETGLLLQIKSRLERFENCTTTFAGVLAASILSSAIACNQSLAILLTHQLCSDMKMEPQEFSIDLENTAVVVSPLIPWSIASTVPLTAVGAPVSCTLFAFYLYLIPLFELFVSLRKKRIRRPAASH